MKTAALALVAGLIGHTHAASVQGFDISDYQPSVNFAAAYSSGARFVIIKATEGTTFQASTFSSHYEGATKAGFIRGGYHFARPDTSTGSAQATYFMAHGGGWTPDGITLPGMIDLEADPYSSNACYGLSTSSMVSWIESFVNEYYSKLKVYPLIYTSRSWWEECTGNTSKFSDECPLVLASWNSSPGTIPGGWPFQTFWQKADTYEYGGDNDVFNGAYSQLQKIALG